MEMIMEGKQQENGTLLFFLENAVRHGLID